MPTLKRDRAIVSIVVGESYQAIAKLTQPHLRIYCDKIGAELIIIPISSRPTPHFEKFRLYEFLDRYQRILYLDVDILINPSCPDLFEIVPEDSIGIYNEGLLATSDERGGQDKVMRKAIELYADSELSGGINPGIINRGYNFYNTGVMVLSKPHRDLFIEPKQEIVMEYCEQPLLNIRILRDTYKTFDIGYKFNRMPYVDDDVKEKRTECHIIHYAGLTNVSELVQKDIQTFNHKKKQNTLTPVDRHAMLDSLNLRDKICVEVGTFLGEYSKQILDRGPKELWLIDPWLHQPNEIYPNNDFANTNPEYFEMIYYSVATRFTRDPRVHIIRDFSLEAAQKFEDNSLDFVYIDAIHTLESCIMDITAWYPKVKPNGWLCGHDYAGKFVGVRHAVDAFCRIIGKKLDLLSTEQFASWGFKK